MSIVKFIHSLLSKKAKNFEIPEGCNCLVGGTTSSYASTCQFAKGEQCSGEECSFAPLSSMNTGDSCQIISVATGNRSLRCKLQALGIVSGNTVEVSQKTPMKNALALEVSNTSIAIRSDEAKVVSIKNI